MPLLVGTRDVNSLLRDFLDDEAPTERRVITSAIIGKIAGIQHRAEEIAEIVRTQGPSDPLARAQAIRSLLRLIDLVHQLEKLFGVHPTA